MSQIRDGFSTLRPLLDELSYENNPSDLLVPLQQWPDADQSVLSTRGLLSPPKLDPMERNELFVNSFHAKRLWGPASGARLRIPQYKKEYFFP